MSRSLAYGYGFVSGVAFLAAVLMAISLITK
ncbi:MAG: hypothetical protein JWN58_1000 [Gammaproteobacteria bacterium]|nr:hypothetical protein [Gammaproteobacteria bacterium]